MNQNEARSTVALFMNQTDTQAGPHPLILATDLDGTFAGGTAADRDRLQQRLSALSDSRLIYVTGRSVEATRALMAELDLPHPDVLIADVGATVAHGAALAPVPGFEAALAESWPGADPVKERLAGLTCLDLQEIRSTRRVGYWLAEGTLEEAIERAAARLGGLTVELIGSAGVYLDIVPAGVNKGTTLRRVLSWLGLSEERVVVAGDSLNDLALLDAGFHGIVVGNCEAALRERVGGRERVYLAAAHGAAGILEGLVHFGRVKEEVHHGQ